MRPLTVTARLHLYPPTHSAGAELMVHTMLRALVARGHRCEVWLSRDTDTTTSYRIDGITVIPNGAGDYQDALTRSDVLVTHLENTPHTTIAARRAGKPIVVVCHNTHPLTKLLLAGMGHDLRVFNSEWMAADIGAPGLIVRPPVLAGEYRTTPGAAVTLVNCCAKKGGRVFARLAARMPDLPFLGVLGAYGRQVPTALPNLTYLPHTPPDQMRERVYARTRVLLMPSSYESWGRTGIEAAASGIPTIAHPTPGLRESLGSAGIFVDRADIDGWQQTLRSLLTDPAAYQQAAQRALARSAELDPTADLDVWCNAVEALAAT